MKVGFVGAGKVGFSIGKMLELAGENVAGYYSRSPHSAEEAADFTHSKFHKKLETLVDGSDMIFITVPDDAIASVWKEIKKCSITDKIICHCSGSLSSEIFSDIEKTNSYGFSIHPLLAVSDRYHSYQDLPKALFTIEGNAKKMPVVEEILHKCGIKTQVISSEIKSRYHAAAVMSSNLIIALISSAQDELKKCGFSDENINMAIEPLIRGNIDNTLMHGTIRSLTGPVERNDIKTVRRHLNTLEGIDHEIYSVLSRKVVAIAKQKHPESNYALMEEIL